MCSSDLAVSGGWEMRYFIDGTQVFAGSCTGDAWHAYGLMSLQNTTVKDVKTEATALHQRFHTLLDRPTGGYVLADTDALPFIYDAEYPNQSPDFEIVDDQGAVVATQASGILKDNFGDAIVQFQTGVGKYHFDLTGFAPGIYSLTLKNIHGETHYLRFKI